MVGEKLSARASGLLAFGSVFPVREGRGPKLLPRLSGVAAMEPLFVPIVLGLPGSGRIGSFALLESSLGSSGFLCIRYLSTLKKPSFLSIWAILRKGVRWRADGQFKSRYLSVIYKIKARKWRFFEAAS
jgi:hypothetical protein